MRPLLSLVMIVKNESKSIRAVLEQVRPFVDRYTVLDTGSTDGTVEIVEDTMQGMSGFVVRTTDGEPFRYDTARNRALDIDRRTLDGAEFQLMLSGDEYLLDGEKLREQLEKNRDSSTSLFRIRLTVDNEGSLYSPRVFRTGAGWKYKSDLPLGLHEFPTHDDPAAIVANIEDASIEHVVADPDARLDNIWQTHIPAMRAHLLAQPDDKRCLVHLAGSLEGLLASPGFFMPGERVTYSMEAMSMYRRRDALGYDNEDERGFVRCQYLACSRLAGLYSNEEMLVRCEELSRLDASRPEAALMYLHAAARVWPISPELYSLAAHAAEVAAKARATVNESPRNVTCEWKAHHTAATIAKKISEKQDKHVLTNGDVVGYWLTRVTEHCEKGLKAGGTWDLFSPMIVGE